MPFWSWLFGPRKEATKTPRCTTQRPAMFEGLEGRALLSATTPPVSPSSLSAKPASSTAIKVSWHDNSNRETGYKVERSTDGRHFSQINVVGRNVTSYTSGHLSKGKKYSFRVRAYSSGGNSHYTNVASATPSSAPKAAEATKVTASSTSASSAPLSPTSLSANSASSTAIKITWHDNSDRETGYKIERSTDGKKFSQINIVGKNIESYISGGLSKGKKYYYRVRAYSSGGNSHYTNVASATPTSTPQAAESTKVTSSSTTHRKTSSFATGGVGAYASGKSYFDGVSYSFDTPGDVNRAIPVLKSLHIGTVRIWWGMTSWNNRGGSWSVQVAQALHNAGFKVIMTFSVADVPSYSQAYSFFSYAKSKSGALSSIDYWEIGNEPNQHSFWKGSPSQYVNNLLKPAWDALHGSGAKVLGAGPTWDANFAKTLVSYGYLKYCDYAGFHPYGPSPQEVLNRANAAKSAYQGKPMIFTEWNVRGSEGNFSEWAKEVDQARKLIAHSAEVACYFPFTVGGTMAGKGGLVNNNSSYSARNPFYDMFKNWGE